MTNFHIKLDNKFNEIISELHSSEKNFGIFDLLKLKSYINAIYDTENDTENEYLYKKLSQISFKI